MKTVVEEALRSHYGWKTKEVAHEQDTMESAPQGEP